MISNGRRLALKKSFESLTGNGDSSSGSNNSKLLSPGTTHNDTSCDIPASFEVYFRTPTSLQLGDVVHGWAELNVEASLMQLCKALPPPLADVDYVLTVVIPVDPKVKTFTITFYGETEYEQNQKSRNAVFEHHTQPLLRSGSDISDSLASCPDKELLPGLYVYDFYVGTSDKLPASFISKPCATIKSLQYYCEAKLVVLLQSKNGKPNSDTDVMSSAHKKPSVSPVFNREVILTKGRTVWLQSVQQKSVLAYQQRTKTNNAGIHVTNFWDMSGYIVATATTDRRVYWPGETILVNVEILNCFRHLKIYLSLEERGNYRLNEEVHSVRQELIRLKLGDMKPEDTVQIWQGFPMWLPSEELAPVSLSNIYSERLLNQQTWVVLRVKPGVLRRPFLVEIPITVKKANPQLELYSGGLRCISERNLAGSFRSASRMSI